MEIQTLRRRDQLLVGFTLFSMFFGAGNLIFPPQLGAQAGMDTWFAMAGLAVSAVFLPILGVIAVVRAGSLTDLASRVHPAFATVFTVLVYLSIGPCLAIPRTASTSFEMAVPPFLPSGTPTMWFQFGYSLLFFAAAFLVALDDEDHVAGYAGLLVVLDEGYITNVAVRPECRRNGIAQKLLQVFLDFAQAHKLAFLTLEVRASNYGAIALYGSRGFRSVGRRKNYYEHPKEDAIIMTKEFTDGTEDPDTGAAADGL